VPMILGFLAIRVPILGLVFTIMHAGLIAKDLRLILPKCPLNHQDFCKLNTSSLFCEFESMIMMQWSILILGLAVTSTALVRFQCSQLVTQRLDPLVTPGLIPSPHVHQIVGGVS
jgi:hypothetical protein